MNDDESKKIIAGYKKAIRTDLHAAIARKTGLVTFSQGSFDALTVVLPEIIAQMVHEIVLQRKKITTMAAQWEALVELVVEASKEGKALDQHAAKSVLSKIKSLEHKKKITRVTKHDAKGRIAEFITWESASE